ncbi:cell division protein FtsW [Candidatus Roizmanbacteria bacterium RIFCSPHIGHO2_02_FULL_37_13b]|uniref:Probable peptidoglycan glycosyltransferase FtsW n=1 Tax=Candidatus Roizmanbacteria bacterium RIFCSPLOWO2_02_FULL_36_11 TaxID=1802071 RepID=A0A1F7JG50_9BACT|nr:MAG: cell division protein FtsW [Candidatus Roizmanbacteria bacterium RIFCSPHIGHO2_02_FULL_37_13b]OGK54597.1 MAG: cell division protein FtsW [Candidatus Roizmanbacteria bacterium RIFCSPLOWO2_02_FULL_36_11]
MNKKLRHLKKDQTQFNLLFFIPILLTIIGLLFIFEASSVVAFRQLGDSYFYLKRQLIWFGLGIVLMIIFSRINYRLFHRLSYPSLIIGMILLILVLIPGIGQKIGGARRWIEIGFINIQPSEIIKFSLILYLSSWFSHKEKNRFISFFGLLIFTIVLIMMQPDMGTAIVIFGLFITVYFLSGYKVGYLLFLIPTALAGFLLLVKSSTYRAARFTAFLNPDSDPLGIGYHIKQILISLANGGIIGRGFSASRQKYQFLPEAHTDSIFAILGEEFGFLGAIVIIVLYIALILQAYKVARESNDKFGQLLAGAIFSVLGLQVVINLGGMVNLIPLTGIPLPFISYGGSSLMVFFALMGILISISKYS